MFWHNLWKNNGSPNSGVLSDIRRRTRARYHTVVRQLRRNSNNIRNANIAKYITEKDDVNLWNEIRKIKSTNRYVPTSVDGMSGEGEIANIFANKYENLYNCVSFDQVKMNAVIDRVNDKVYNICLKGKCQNHCDTINSDDVSAAIKCLKKGKKGGSFDLETDHIINGTRKLCNLLAELFSCMIKHGFCPEKNAIWHHGSNSKSPRNK